MSKFIVTEYREQVKNAQSLALDKGPVKDHESFEDPDAFIITFTEEPESSFKPKKFDQDILDAFSPEQIEDVSEFFEVDQDELMDKGDAGAMPFKLPGAVDYVEDDFEEEEEEEEEETPTDWENDRDVQHFMEYILRQYPGGIPKHDGKSTLGCERAIRFLTGLNREISEALQKDENDCLDLNTLENMRVSMVRDVITLKEHIKKLNKKHKKAELEVNPDLAGFDKFADFQKEASTARIQMVITPFQRAIAGIIINSVVSAGKPLEDVYDFLKKKYKFTDREELEILQLLMDMGQPIFKDRGMIGESEEDGDQQGQGLDFIKNYFG